MPKYTGSKKRKSEKYPALKPQLNLRTRFEIIDYDYLDQLSNKEKEWLNKFSEEYINASFKDKKDRIHNPNKKIIKEIKPDGTEIKITYEKDSYDRNNARNRDVLTRSKAQGENTDLSKQINKLSDLDEDLLNAFLDLREIYKKGEFENPEFGAIKIQKDYKLTNSQLDLLITLLEHEEEN